jgi:hypothetical protein
VNHEPDALDHRAAEAQPHPPARLKPDELTSDDLDQLHDRLDRAEHELQQWAAAESADAAAGSYALRAEQAEAAITRVRAFHVPNERGNCAARCYTEGIAPARWPCPTITALDQPTED